MRAGLRRGRWSIGVLEPMKALELFAGAGGAALGLRQAGIEALACVELNAAAIETLKAAGFPAIRADLKTWSWEGERPDLLWSSFPCQVFSKAGKRNAARDCDRNGWPWTLRLVDETAPTWVVLENVKGLTMHTEAECGGDGCAACYFESQILAELRKRFRSVQHVLLNAADYGLAQHRTRLFVIAGPCPIRWPEPTHAAPDQTLGLFRELSPWVTMGEALGIRCGKLDNNDPADLPERRMICLTNRPACTVPAMYAPKLGGQMFAICDDGGTRPLSVCELATLQGLDGLKICGTTTQKYRQIGNAVPPILARLIAGCLGGAE
jgi:DNA (cytosine-5)-methyltransferase 1